MLQSLISWSMINKLSTRKKSHRVKQFVYRVSRLVNRQDYITTLFLTQSEDKYTIISMPLYNQGDLVHTFSIVTQLILQ